MDGARRPFLVVEGDLWPRRPLALGADATLRRNFDAVAPMDLGERGLCVFGVATGDPARPNDEWDGPAVCGPLWTG